MVDDNLRLYSHWNPPIHYKASRVTFGLFSKNDILKLSKVEVSSPLTFNNLGHPIENGLYDLRMGPFTDREGHVCTTCHLAMDYCPGHFGHITLPLPVINPLFYPELHKLLKMSCIKCHRFKVPQYHMTLFQIQMNFLNLGLIEKAQEAAMITDVADSANEGVKNKKISRAEDTNLTFKLQEFEKRSLAEIGTDKLKKNLREGPVRSLESLKRDYLKEFLQMATKSVSTCVHCGMFVGKVIRTKTGFIYEGAKNAHDGEMGETFEEALKSSLGARKRRKAEDKSNYEITPKDLRDHLREVYRLEPGVLDFLFPVLKSPNRSEHPTDFFFMEIVPVPPCKSRPAIFAADMLSLHPQSKGLLNVIETSLTLKQFLKLLSGVSEEELPTEILDVLKSLRGENDGEKMSHLWKELQNHVDHIVDRELNKMKSDEKFGYGLKQLIERKQGLFRMHMMGKRVNHACRTVITPDPMIGIDEIGIPEIFAKRLSYPVPVTEWNVAELRQLVINGPDVHPGANMVEDESGKITYLQSKDKQQRRMIANTLLTPGYRHESMKKTQRRKIVYRHLWNGDAMLLNRQPTLHKPSIMAHKAKILTGHKVMRLNYSNCKSYNADFDGDEMNAHFPQSEMARSEAYNIVASSHQYLDPKGGQPLQGLIQDHVISGVKLTIRGRFFERGEYLNLVYQGLQDQSGYIKTLPPAIIKPKQLWSGKQVISTILINLVPKGKRPPNLNSSAKISPKLWTSGPVSPVWKAGGTPFTDALNMTESQVIIRQGELLVGILDKNQYGATQYSLCHLCFELYGGQMAARLLSSLCKLFTDFIRNEGFTLGVEDIMVRGDANLDRKAIMKETRKLGDESAAKGVGLKGRYTKETLNYRLEEVHREGIVKPSVRGELDHGYKGNMNTATNKINGCCVPKGLIKSFPANNLQLMVQSGAKGSSVNTMQISGLLGQIELEGKRPPLMISGKALPSFKAYDTQPRAGGFIDGRFMTGIQPQEFFYHCMAGREGLIDTAVKTSRSGYLQRCLIKLLEGLVVKSDFTVRDSDNTIVQFQYGEDTLDVCKAQYLKKETLDYLADNLDVIHDQDCIERAIQFTDTKGLKKAKKKAKKWMERQDNGDSTNGRRRTGAFLSFTSSDSQDPPAYSKMKLGRSGDKMEISRSAKYFDAVEEYRNLSEEAKEKLAKKTASSPAPVASEFPPPAHFGSLTEVCDKLIESYLETKKGVDKDKFREAIQLKVQTAAIPAGEPVGVLAAQSLGEPSTQMTLNTFHFAGRGEMNVTLGIPRLREILMVASDKIKTPSMDIPFRPDVKEKKMDQLRLKFNRVLLSDVLEEVQVTEMLQIKPDRCKLVAMRFKLLPHDSYKHDFGVTPAQVVHYIENTFFKKVFSKVMVALLSQKKIVVESAKDSQPRSKASGASDGDKDKDEDAKMGEVIDKAMGEQGDSDNDDEFGGGQGDEGTDVARRLERQEEREYEEMEEEEEDLVRDLRKMEDSGDELMDDDDEGEAKRPEAVEAGLLSEDEAIGMEEDQDEMSQELVQKEAMASVGPAKRRSKFLDTHQNLPFCRMVEYQFDTEEETWCEATFRCEMGMKQMDVRTILLQSAERAVIHEVKNLNKAFISEENGVKKLKTDGINIDVMLAHSHLLDINKLVCNNIHTMARYYGIEAACRTIIKELTNVFGVYGIHVDYRHLSLIAEFMTWEGKYKPFNRVGIETSSSPLQQMSFETAMHFLKNSVLSAKTDMLSSPSACLVIGTPMKGGTGSFSLKAKLT